MFRHAVSFTLTLLLTCTVATNFAFAKQPKEVKLKQKIVEWGTNKNVSVKLKSGSKIDGRIAEIKDTNFAVQLVENGQVVTREISYSDVDKLSVKGNAGRVAGRTALGVLAGVGAIFVMLFVIYAVSES
jgi:hypothetical protein